MTYGLRTPILLKLMYHSLIWDRRGKEKKIYLTFDDGPTPGVTRQVLDVLKKYNAKATFFCLGRNVERNPDIYQQILAEGHKTGNHTYSHLKGWQSTDKDYLDDIALAANFIDSDLFRPPYGQIGRKQIKLLRDHYNLIMWDVMSLDYAKQISKEKSLRIVNRNTRPGSIVVFHDSEKCAEKVYYVLPRYIERFLEKGYSFEGL